MNDYFGLLANSLLLKLNTLKDFDFKHNPTIGVLTEEILKDFLREHLPKFVGVNQGFIMNSTGKCSKQCDIIIWNSTSHAPFYRIHDIVIVPVESVIAVIEVKTTLNQGIFHNALDYFIDLLKDFKVKTYLFAYNSEYVEKIGSFFHSFEFTDKRRSVVEEIFPPLFENWVRKEFYDHDTYELLPDEITGLNDSYHLKKDYVISDGDYKGYSAFYYENQKGTEINALQHFYVSIYAAVEEEMVKVNIMEKGSRSKYFKGEFQKYNAIELFGI